jgi:flavin reductase (DIM6/NTAB) family NADH-FMN oxidoreductase RutF
MHRGVTVNSFTSVSLDPPLVSFCLSKASSLLPAFELDEHFAINVLASHQTDLSRRFARPSLNRDWEDIRFREDETGCALLDGALASFSCRRRNVHDGGDHVIVVGEVTQYEMDGAGEPLVFYAGRYGGFLPDDYRPYVFLSEAEQYVSYWG